MDRTLPNFFSYLDEYYFNAHLILIEKKIKTDNKSESVLSRVLSITTNSESDSEIKSLCLPYYSGATTEYLIDIFNRFNIIAKDCLEMSESYKNKSLELPHQKPTSHLFEVKYLDSNMPPTKRIFYYLFKEKIFNVPLEIKIGNELEYNLLVDWLKIFQNSEVKNIKNYDFANLKFPFKISELAKNQLVESIILLNSQYLLFPYVIENLKKLDLFINKKSYSKASNMEYSPNFTSIEVFTRNDILLAKSFIVCNENSMELERDIVIYNNTPLISSCFNSSLNNDELLFFGFNNNNNNNHQFIIDKMYFRIDDEIYCIIIPFGIFELLEFINNKTE
ncbi:hypothetical protein [uncultured Trichococcus sp.]|uniref:hypothetical protein n=1 Tax=uncultured Trichococcus sp. TaxID=189665 RepID=UPI002A189778|nr:hypothetical protein [uncultured Trichococcus sp.]